MAERFQFKLLTGADPDSQYAGITTKNLLTFYLLSNGKGYLGDTKLFDASDIDSITYLAAIDDSESADKSTYGSMAPSVQAVVDYVTAKCEAASILSDAFFNAVVSHTVTQADLDNEDFNAPTGTSVGDVGLMFTKDTDSDDSEGATYYFISLMNYLQTVHTFANTNSIKFTVDENNQVTADLNVKTDENSIIIDSNGVSLNKTVAIDEDNPNADKLVTESALIAYINDSVLAAVENAITDAMKDVVTWTQDTESSTS